MKINAQFNWDGGFGSAIFEAMEGKFERVFAREIWEEGYYFAHGAKINRNGVVLDIGGHIGLFSVLADMLGGRVYTFEPVLKHFNYLMHNLVENRCTNTTPILGAVMDVSGVMQVQIPEETEESNSGTAFVGQPIAGFGSQLCKVYSIHEVLQMTGKIDFMKIDCEGGEYAILYGMTDKEFEETKQISMEFHIDPQSPQLSALESGTKLKGFLESKGYTVFLDWTYGNQGRIVALR